MRLVSVQKCFSFVFQKDSKIGSIMAQSSGSNTGKKLIRIDVSSDSVCPWCFVGKRNLDKAIAQSKDQFDSVNTYTDIGACVMHIILTYSCSLQIKWHPFFLDPSAPKEGVSKREYYEKKFGSRTQVLLAQITEIFRNVGLEYDMSGLTGNTLDSHRLIYFAGKQGLDKQHALVEELYLGYFTQGKYIGDREFLLESARKVGVEGAAEFLENPNKGVKEVNEDLQKYSANISGVPNYVINGKQQLSGGQPPEVFLRAFHVAAK